VVDVQSRCGRISVTEQGSGFPVVLLHATLCDHHDFDPVIPALAERYRVITVDWPWHGESDSPAAPLQPGAALFADVLQEVVTGLGLGQAVFIGNSVGGFAAARLAITNPRRVAGLVLVNNGGFIPASLFTQAFCKIMGTPPVTRMLLAGFTRLVMAPKTDNDRQIVKRVAARLRTREGVSTGAALWRSFATAEHDLRPHAAELTAPTLILWGTKDIGVPLRVGRATHNAIVGSRLELLDTGHMPFSSEPVVFLSLVMPFIQSVMQTIGV
jgi:pimeloyl-ACP methyl ester carboxylesterase